MGASDWVYYTKFVESLDQALEQVQEKVFQSGEFAKPSNSSSQFKNFSKKAVHTLQAEAGFSGTHSILDMKFLSPFPRSLDDWHQANQMQRTTGRLDPDAIAGIFESAVANLTSKELDPNLDELSRTIFALSDAEMIDVFGTPKPTKDQGILHEDEILSRCKRYEGRYVILYVDDSPSEIMFAGVSGD
jgi:glycosidase